MSAQEVAAPRLITLTCPTCGAKLKLGSKVNLLVCASCGNEHIVNRDGGAIYLEPMAADMQQIRANTDKTAAELAIPRLIKELHELDQELGAATKKDYSYLVQTKSGNGGFGSFAFLALIFLIALPAIPAMTKGYVWVGLTLLVIACIGFLVFANAVGKQMDRRRLEADTLKEMACAPLQKAKQAKQAQLSQARQIANGAI